jgi:hypothetical protein
MKTAFVGFCLMAVGAMFLVPGTDTKPYWGLMGIGFGMILGRIAGSFSHS